MTNNIVLFHDIKFFFEMYLYNGVYYVMDSIGGMLNPIGKKCQKHTTKRNFVMVLLEKANGILMKTIRIYVY